MPSSKKNKLYEIIKGEEISLVRSKCPELFKQNGKGDYLAEGSVTLTKLKTCLEKLGLESEPEKVKQVKVKQANSTSD